MTTCGLFQVCLLTLSPRTSLSSLIHGTESEGKIVIIRLRMSGLTCRLKVSNNKYVNTEDVRA